MPRCNRERKRKHAVEEKWAYRCKVKSKTYTLCSYSCTTKAINDSEAIKDDFVRHEKTISSEIAEIESKKQKKTIPPAHSFNEWTERKESRKEEKAREDEVLEKENENENTGLLLPALWQVQEKKRCNCSDKNVGV